MFKVLVLQALYSLSDDAAEFQVRDRLSFMRFLGLMFERFDAALHEAGYLAMGGQIIDGTVVAAPRQKLTDDEKTVVRGGGTPSGWSKAKRRQKDLDARWTIKRGRSKRSETNEMQAQASRSRCRCSVTRITPGSISGMA